MPTLFIFSCSTTLHNQKFSYKGKYVSVFHLLSNTFFVCDISSRKQLRNNQKKRRSFFSLHTEVCMTLTYFHTHTNMASVPQQDAGWHSEWKEKGKAMFFLTFTEFFVSLLVCLGTPVSFKSLKWQCD